MSVLKPSEEFKGEKNKDVMMVSPSPAVTDRVKGPSNNKFNTERLNISAFRATKSVM